MLFLAGFIIGLLISVLVTVTVLYFRSPIESVTNKVSKNVSNKGPRAKGFIVEPEPESEELRKQIIEKNRAEGKDTHISELL